jgi:glutamate/tyrosine decarboxylase-like PLP-dependent enzyme
LYICFILIQGGSIAAAWVSMRALGVDGYTSKAKQLMETTDKLKKGIAEIDVCLF